MGNDTKEATHLAKSKENSSGYGITYNAMEYLAVGAREIVFRFFYRSEKRLRTGRRPGSDIMYWYEIYGWRTSLRYTRSDGITAVRVIPVAEEEKPAVLEAIRAAKKIEPTYRIIFHEWERRTP